ncbi:Snf7 family protein [[Eubacterium] cellulosolvens]
MPSRAIKGWIDEDRSRLITKVGGKFKARGLDIKERLNTTVIRLKSQLDKLEFATDKIDKHDQKLFQKCVEAQVSKDRARAIMYANECAELRRIMKTTLSCKLALEQVTLRLETVSRFNEIGALMSPVGSVVNSVKDQLSGIMPEVSYELGEIHQNLDSLATDFGEVTEFSEPSSIGGEEATSIIQEATAIAEQRIKDKFPDVPPQRQPENRIPENY